MSSTQFGNWGSTSSTSFSLNPIQPQENVKLHLTEEERAYYNSLYALNDTAGAGRIVAGTAGRFLRKSGLDTGVLKSIWIAVATSSEGLDKEEFLKALKLISYAQNGIAPTVQSLQSQISSPLPKLLNEAGQPIVPFPTAPKIAPKPVVAQGSGWQAPASSSTASGGSAVSIEIPLEKLERYEQYVTNYKTQQPGILAPADAKDLFTKTGLDPQILANVWRSLVGTKGHLDKGEFIVALHLLYLARQGLTITPTLNPILASWLNNYKNKSAPQPQKPKEDKFSAFDNIEASPQAKQKHQEPMLISTNAEARPQPSIPLQTFSQGFRTEPQAPKPEHHDPKPKSPTASINSVSLSTQPSSQAQKTLAANLYNEGNQTLQGVRATQEASLKRAEQETKTLEEVLERTRGIFQSLRSENQHYETELNQFAEKQKILMSGVTSQIGEFVSEIQRHSVVTQQLFEQIKSMGSIRANEGAMAMLGSLGMAVDQQTRSLQQTASVFHAMQQGGMPSQTFLGQVEKRRHDQEIEDIGSHPVKATIPSNPTPISQPTSEIKEEDRRRHNAGNGLDQPTVAQNGRGAPQGPATQPMIVHSGLVEEEKRDSGLEFMRPVPGAQQSERPTEGKKEVVSAKPSEELKEKGSPKLKPSGETQMAPGAPLIQEEPKPKKEEKNWDEFNSMFTGFGEAGKDNEETHTSNPFGAGGTVSNFTFDFN